MKLKHIQHIFFDLDHTLWDFDKNSALTFQKIFKLNNITVNIEAFLKTYHPINLNYWKLYREEKITKENLRYGRLNDTFNALNITVEDTIINKLSIDYISYLTTFNHVFNNTHSILSYLVKNYTLHIITNGFKEAQENKLKNANIDHFFTTITNSEMVGVKKPNPTIFNYALNQAKAKKEHSIMIGDNLEADIYGALDFGIDVIYYNYHKEKPTKPVKTINQLIQLKQYL